MKLDMIVNQPVIEAGRFVLRPVRKSDVGLLELFAGDERVARFTRSIPHPLPPGATEAFVVRSQQDNPDEYVWVMDGAAHGLSEVLGVVGLKPIGPDQSEIGYWVAPAYWNTGLASEAVTAILAANPLRNSSIVAAVFQDNPGSARVLTNAGFDYIGAAEAFSIARKGMVATWTYLKKLK